VERTGCRNRLYYGEIVRIKIAVNTVGDKSVRFVFEGYSRPRAATTFAPAVSSRMTVAAPMPDPPPVTMNAFPSSPVIDVRSFPILGSLLR
jgi:hypothetical protein